MKDKNELLERFIRFAVSIIKLANRLPKTPAGYAIASQIVKSGTSIGANSYEAQSAVSNVDFVNKLGISLKEARETSYWLLVIKQSELVGDDDLERLLQEINEIIAILVKSIKTAKKI